MPDFTITIPPRIAQFIQSRATKAGVTPKEWLRDRLGLATGFGSEYHDWLREEASKKRGLVDEQGSPRVMTHEEAAGTDILEAEVFDA